MEILNVGTATIDYISGWSVSVIIFGLFALGCFIGGNLLEIFDYGRILGLFLIIFAGLFLFMAFFMYDNCTPVEVTTYQVILNDDVSYNEFVEKYEVIKQEGRIYTIYEKDKEN